MWNILRSRRTTDSSFLPRCVRWPSAKGAGLAINRSRGSNPGRRAAECNPGQVVYTHVPLSPSSIIWYQPMGGDAQPAGEVTAGMAESNDSLYRRVYDFGSPAR